MMGQSNVFPIAGNHDFAAFLALKSLTTELTDGSIREIEEFHDFEQMLLWLSDGGHSTLKAFNELPEEIPVDTL